MSQKKSRGLDSESAQQRDQAIIDRMYPIIEKHEKNLDYPYKDTAGNITVGTGKNIHKKELFDSIPWQDERGNPVGPDDIEAHYQKLLQLPHNNIKATYYEDKTPLRISEAESRRLYEEHMKNDLQGVRKSFPKFDVFPDPLQNVVLDIKYNMGNVDKEHWPNLHQAIEEKNLEKILKNISRKNLPDRNQWAADEIKKIERLDY